MLTRPIAKLILLAVVFATPVLTDTPKVRRLETINWNPQDNKLTWTVSNRTRNDKGESVFAAGKPPSVIALRASVEVSV
jgi:hypothetical protein